MEQTCCVCGEAVDNENVSGCNFCGGHFHMAWSQDACVNECGRYWISDQHPGLAFVCSNCETEIRTKEDG